MKLKELFTGRKAAMPSLRADMRRLERRAAKAVRPGPNRSPYPLNRAARRQWQPVNANALVPHVGGPGDVVGFVRLRHGRPEFRAA